MVHFVESEQICINCKGTKWKIGLLAVLATPFILFVGGMLALSRFRAGNNFLGTVLAAGSLLWAFSWRRDCPACNGTGKVKIIAKHGDPAP